MAGNGKIVVLCKGFSEKSDKQETYVETLESAGYSCKYLQTLRFEFVNISELRACLAVADRYSGNISYITSNIINISNVICYFFIYFRFNINKSSYS